MTKQHIQPLPSPSTTAGEPRRVGIEVEFAGLAEADVAGRIAEALGGTATRKAPFHHVVTGTELGEVTVVLDTKFRKQASRHLVQAGLELARGLVPAEIVTDPILPQDIPRLDALLSQLAGLGATGTGDGIARGFGTHLNVQLAENDAGGILPILRAYALAEAGIREAEPIDATRAMLPFVRPYPRRLVDRLAAAESDDWSLNDLCDSYLELAASRNHALDLLPILAELRPDRVSAALGDASAVSARPAFHFRLPDSRPGDPDWSVAREWNRWVAIETLAADAPRMARLRADWQAHRATLINVPGDWARNAAAVWSDVRRAVA